MYERANEKSMVGVLNVTEKLSLLKTEHKQVPM